MVVFFFKEWLWNQRKVCHVVVLYVYCVNMVRVQGTASEATLVTLLGARTKALERVKENNPDKQDAEIMAKLVTYCSDQASHLVI